MSRSWKSVRWALAGGTLYVLGGCFTSGQLQDFVSTEFARVISSSVQQLLELSIRATSPIVGA